MPRYLQKLKRFGYRILALGGIRAPVAFMLRLSRLNPVPAVIDPPDASKVLVLAPHMDDETIGCGGTLHAHASAGAEVHVVFITDGRRGFGPAERAAATIEELCAIRREEARRACSLLGVRDLHFLDLPDGRSRAVESAVDSLQAVFEAVGPDLVYLPFLTDSHHDHQTTNELFLALLRRQPHLGGLLCCAYEVWTPLYPNCIIDISEYMENKLAALGCYTSQLAMNDYISSVRGLNAYRSIANSSRGYAEAFFLTSAAEYRSLANQLAL
mgnify:CR=1 FL=1